MATVFRCDKCDTESKKATALVKVVIADVGTTELCARCVQRLRSWLEPDPKESPSSPDVGVPRERG